MYSHFAGVVIQTDWPPLRASRSIYRAVSDNTKPVICILMFLVRKIVGSKILDVHQGFQILKRSSRSWCPGPLISLVEASPARR